MTTETTNYDVKTKIHNLREQNFVGEGNNLFLSTQRLLLQYAVLTPLDPNTEFSMYIALHYSHYGTLTTFTMQYLHYLHCYTHNLLTMRYLHYLH